MNLYIINMALQLISSIRLSGWSTKLSFLYLCCPATYFFSFLCQNKLNFLIPTLDLCMSYIWFRSSGKHKSSATEVWDDNLFHKFLRILTWNTECHVLSDQYSSNVDALFLSSASKS
jgi:hypothetical protein